MGMAKRELARQQDVHGAAVAIALEVGLLEECDTCGDVRDPWSGEQEAAYKLGSYLWGRKDNRVAHCHSHGELMDAIRDVTIEYNDCHCQRQWAKLQAE